MPAPHASATSALANVDAFIARWEAAGGNERANYQLFLTELCALLALPQPDPAREDTRDNAYVFERRVSFRHGDGSESNGFADLYRRGAFVLEAKKIRKADGRAFDDAMLRARSQAEQYARALPAEEGRPPFLVVVDVGSVIELYSEFTRSGATYTPFPDPRSHRIKLLDLRNEVQRERLKQVWLDPMALDPTRRSARVTREVAVQLAAIAQALEQAGNAPETVAGFLTRCLFSMFAEDVGLLPKRAFVELLEHYREDPATLARMMGALWREMDSGGFSAAIAADVLRFNGKIFKDQTVLPLDRDQIGLLLEAARFNWREVEPAIFGTLFERALDPEERHRLGGHYTPRAYVERLVLPTVIEPLREDWKNAQAAVLFLAGEGKMEEARKALHRFHHSLCEVRVLDPACGSGNFLYVTLEHLKRLEGEILNQLDALGDTQGKLETEGVTVDPHQLLGIEVNPRAAAITELVLWIGYLQWHFRTRGQVMPPQPVLKDFRNIECRDAVLAWDRIEYETDDRGVPKTRWDGKTMKKHPVTGEDVPDDRAQVPMERYVNPHKAEWPKAHFVVGNPPFIGNKRMREVLGDGYVEALRAARRDVPDSVDFVMYWWDHAAELTRMGNLRRFGLIATNSLRQTYNRRVLDRHLGLVTPLSLAYAVPDHPWVDGADGAAVRISMTVGRQGTGNGTLNIVVAESQTIDGEALVDLEAKTGWIGSDLRVGPNVAHAALLRSNIGLCWQGCKLVGSGFQVSPAQADALANSDSHVKALFRRYWAGGDITQTRSERSVIDTYGLSIAQLRSTYPAAYQHLFDRVYPERTQNRDKAFRERWWLFGRSRPELRLALNGLRRYIATSEVSKHRFFVFLDWPTDLVDGSITALALADAFWLGIVSSYLHLCWALAAGGTLEDRPRYQNGPCFDNFPFPVAESRQQICIRDLAEQLDAHRKRQQAAHPALTLTGMYNVLEKLKCGEPLTAKEATIHEQGLVSVLKHLHDEIDLAVLEAYGWGDLALLMQTVNGNTHPASGSAAATREEGKRLLNEALLHRLVALNAERAAEEARGLVRWLRPEFQNPVKPAAPAMRTQVEIEMPVEEVPAVASVPAAKRPWPRELPEQVRQVAEVLAGARAPLADTAIAERFSGRGRWRERVPQIVETLVSVGRARRVPEGVIGLN
ncbi:MAG: class I SAM-dependent DNA methyltransferase [Betaproteobacteria bacterium]|nr:class I SAM-dependent DNA methyltransferase [Betaproteobacteria bacterium]